MIGAEQKKEATKWWHLTQVLPCSYSRIFFRCWVTGVVRDFQSNTIDGFSPVAWPSLTTWLPMRAYETESKVHIYYKYRTEEQC